MDFCVGPHVPSSGRLKAFKLLTTSNAYWKGDARNQPMQRVYGTAFLTEKELAGAPASGSRKPSCATTARSARTRSCSCSTRGRPGATFWLPKGTIIYNTLADYMREVLVPAGYTEVKAPIVFNKALWETSGHWRTTARTCSWWSPRASRWASRR